MKRLILLLLVPLLACSETEREPEPEPVIPQVITDPEAVTIVDIDPPLTPIPGLWPDDEQNVPQHAIVLEPAVNLQFITVTFSGWMDELGILETHNDSYYHHGTSTTQDLTTGSRILEIVVDAVHGRSLIYDLRWPGGSASLPVWVPCHEGVNN